MLNAIKTYDVICKWISSADKDTQLDVLTLFITDTFSKRFPSETNDIHCQFIGSMLEKIEKKRIVIDNQVRQRFPVDDEY
jgi:hypothetical protein